VKLLKDRIQAEGRVMPGNILNVGSFLNQQADIGLFNEIGREFARRFIGKKVTRILTIESSGIGLACIAAQYFNNVPVVFARKYRVKTIGGSVHSAKVMSFTQGIEYNIVVSKEHLKLTDSVLLIDDFLANGHAIEGLIELVKSAGAELAGVGIIIEKGFQNGGERLRGKNIPIESLSIIDHMSPEEGICFREKAEAAA
jgi:xanthine phosphoribosyltransferase